MTGRHTRLIVLAMLAIVVVSAAVDAQQVFADLRARAEQGDAEAMLLLREMAERGVAPAQRPIRGVADIAYLAPDTTVESGEVVTRIVVQNRATGVIVGLKVDEFWWDSDRNPLPGDSQRLRQPLMPGEVITFELRPPRDNRMTYNQYSFSHANGQINAQLVEELTNPEVEYPNLPVPTGGTGTAFIVHPNGLLLTAHHVIDGATSITVSCNGQPAVPATVESSSPTIDLAILKASRGLGTRSFLRLSPNRVPSLGDTVFTMGYPAPSLLGPDVKYTNGTVSALSGLGGDASFLQISVPIQPGNSGGPLVNEDGDVVGIVLATAAVQTFVQAADAFPQNINWAVKSAFASALFTPPTASAPSGGGDVIERVTEATCLVRATVTAQ
jgi:S1-C subfamily serine protease